MSTSAVVFQRVQPVVIVEPTIDIDEPIRLYRGEFTEVSFRFFPGDPPADRPFGMEFYLMEADAYRGENLLTEDLPTYQLIPHAPYPFPDNFEGLARFYAPLDWSYTEIYGKIIICQEDATRFSPIGDPKRQSVSPISPPRRRHIPTWEDR